MGWRQQIFQMWAQPYKMALSSSDLLPAKTLVAMYLQKLVFL